MSIPLPMFPLQDRSQEVVAAIQPLRFEVRYKPIFKSVNGAQIDTGEMRREVWVEWAKKGVSIPATTPQRVDRIQKAAERATEPDDEAAAIWRAIKPYYDNWLAGGDKEVVSGTPLAVWPGVTREVVESLRPFRIYSVEDLASAKDDVLQRVPDPNIMRYRDRAKTYLQTKDIAVAVRELDNEKAEKEALKKAVEELQRKLADMQFSKEKAEEELDAATPPVARKRRAAA